MNKKAELRAKHFFWKKEVERENKRQKVFLAVGYSCSKCMNPLFYYLGPRGHGFFFLRPVRQYAINPITMDIPSNRADAHYCSLCGTRTKTLRSKIYKFIGRRKRYERVGDES